MKEELRKIFLDLADKKLSEAEALESIRAIKKSHVKNQTSTLYATPTWTLVEKSASPQEIPFWYTEHRILCIQWAQLSVKQLALLIPQSSCYTIQTEQTPVFESFGIVAVACMEHIQTLLNGKPNGKVLVQIVIGDSQKEEIYKGLSALLKTASLENPNFVGQLIISDRHKSATELSQELLYERHYATETLIKYDNGKRYKNRLQELPVARFEPHIIFKEHGVYLITGGFGGLGWLVAKEISAQTPHASIILTGRAVLTKKKKELLQELSAKGKEVEYVKMDVTDREEVQKCLATIVKNHHGINGIVHTAGINTDNFILKKQAEEFKKVLEPKVSGAYNLDAASQDIDLDFIVFFSSIAACFGNVGQCDYAAANGFMDQFASYRNQLVDCKERQGKTLSINWPFWEEGGMSIPREVKERFQEETGILPLDTATGMHFFYHCMGLPYSQVLPVKGNLDQMRNAFFTNPTEHGTKSITEKVASSDTEGFPEIGTDNKGLLEKTKNFLREEFSIVLKLPSRKIETKAPLEAYGIDSILAMNLTGQLEKTFGKLSKTMFFEYQTIDELTEYFLINHIEVLSGLFREAYQNASMAPKKKVGSNTYGKHGQSNRAPIRKKVKKRTNESFDSPSISNHLDKKEAIAIIGVSGRYPESIDVQQYWENLKNGKDCIVEVPKERWDWREFYSEDRTQSGRHYSKWGGFIAGVDEFDPRFFNISPKEAQSIDPQERLFLQHAWMAVEDAGYTREGLRASSEKDRPGQVGVYAGVMYGEYNLSGSLASIANRVSYILNLHGPSMTLDTMCSSSLTSVHLACQDLKSRRISMALAGGVNVSVDPNKYQMLSKGQFISSDGHCQSFGEGGDGYIPGEGVGVVVLKRLSDAERDGDHIYGIIKGSALNHGGKTNGYSVPNPKAQASAIGMALKESNTKPLHISYVEAHGTGTKLGDPIEITSLNRAFGSVGKNHTCLLGSAKSNIGHCESAAGIAGLTKIILQLKYQQVVPSLHSESLNPHIDFENTPFIVNQSLQKWETPVIDGKKIPRIAGISSFGAGGANAHVIVAEYEQVAVSTHVPAGEVAIVLSARTAEQLKEKALDMVKFLRKQDQEGRVVDLNAMAYTLQVGREAMEFRWGLSVGSVSELQDTLGSFSGNGRPMEKGYQGKVKDHKDAVSDFRLATDFKGTMEGWLLQRDYDALLTWWCKGLDVDWGDLYVSAPPRRMSLPTYPFAKERYWLDPSARGRGATSGKTMAMLHPLVHRNTSDLAQINFSSTFSGDEFFIEDYALELGGEQLKALPFMAAIEMIRATIVQGLASNNGVPVLELRNLCFGSSITFEKERPIHIVLFGKDDKSVVYEVYSEDQQESLVYCQGEGRYLALNLTDDQLDIHGLIGEMGNHPVSAETFYSCFSNDGILHGSAYRGIKTLYMGEDQLVAHLVLPLGLENDMEDYHLHPALAESALQSATALVQDLKQFPTSPLVPDSIESVRILSSCTKEMHAWVRHADDSKRQSAQGKIDIDLCDQNGTICVQMQGISYLKEPEVVRPETINSHATPQQLAPIVHAPKEVFFSTNRIENSTLSPIQSKGTLRGPLEKPTDIVLGSLDATFPNSGFIPSNIKVQITLSAPQEVLISRKNVPMVRLYDKGEGIYTLKINSGDENKLSRELIGQLLGALNVARAAAEIKVLVVQGIEDYFLQGGREAYNHAIKQKLHLAFVSFPYPVIAAMQGNAHGIGFLIGSLCDFVIFDQQGTYGYTRPEKGFYPSLKEHEFFRERFGRVRANDFLMPSPTNVEGFMGSELKAKGWKSPIVSKAEVMGIANHLAKNLCGKSQTSLRLLKQHLARQIKFKAERLGRVPLRSYDTISKANKNSKLPTPSGFTVKRKGNDILVVRVRKSGSLGALAKGLRSFFTKMDNALVNGPIVLTSGYTEFVPKDATASDILELAQVLLRCKLPIIAVLGSGTNSFGWFLGQFCDATFYDSKATYNATDLLQVPELSSRAAMIFAHRFGDYYGREILLLGGDHSGSTLRERVGTIRAFERDRIASEALKLAESWSKLPLEILMTWKRESSKAIQNKTDRLSDWIITKEKGANPQKNGPIALRSSVVKAILHPDGIVEVRLEDRVAKNMFTDALIEGVTEVFSHIDRNPFYKVVVLTGYDHYFASGGTKEGLLAIQDGKSKFTDTKIYQMAMECKIPVIAAMQGHAIGAGWGLGMFADFTLFSKERKYMSPYMRYGFTPGAGATFIFPKTMGHDLARETLLLADEYSGGELKEKGLELPVLNKDEVLDRAMQWAKRLSRISRAVLTAFKSQFTQNLLPEVENTCQLELEMHQKTFVGNKETLDRIESNFTHRLEEPIMEIRKAEEILDKEYQEIESDEDLLADVMFNIKAFLAQELHLHQDEIDDDTQFVDIGLDSITGVTWVRKINDKYDTSLEATQIYNYTTLNTLGAFVKEVLEKRGIPTEKTVGDIAAKRMAQDPDWLRNGVERNLSNGDLSSDVIFTIKSFLAKELHMHEDEIDEDAQFVDIGLDSITGVTWIRKINDHYKTSLEATQIYGYPTLEKLGGFVLEELEKLGFSSTDISLKEAITKSKKPFPKSVLPKKQAFKAINRKLASLRDRPSPKTAAKKAGHHNVQPIAIVGMAGQFPGAIDKEAFWKNIAEGKNCIKEVRKERWDINEYYNEGTPVPGKTNSKWMGSLSGYDQFDPLFFTISPVEAESMDPQQRLFLQSCWHSIEDAGYNPQVLSGTKCGVFVGCATGDYQLLSREQQLSSQGFTGGTSSILAARISYFLNLQGPCLALDTACSSSLVAIANACDSLVSGSSDSALAGGVYIMTGPEMHVKTAQSGMLSQDGKCHTFDQSANGFVPGEGVGVVMLKRLEDAERDNDRIYGVIQGWGVNQDGRTNGITAPNAVSQTALEQEVYDKFEINPEHIQLVEAHGTGTKLGDPIEVDALKKAFGKYTAKNDYCALGSVKSNIGHCLTAAGVAGFMKVMLAMENKKLPPTINYGKLNEHISLENSPFYINDTLKDWEVAQGAVRQAALSAFGFSGTNAHMVLGEYVPKTVVKAPVIVLTQHQKYIVPLSARNPEQLEEMAENLLSYIQENQKDLDLVEMSYTLQVGREPMEERLGFMVKSVAELAIKLEAYLQGDDTEKDVYQGQVKRNKEGLRLVSKDPEMKRMIIEKWVLDKKLNKLLDLWVKGLAFDWEILYNDGKPRRLHLPIYPFAKERYWIERVEQSHRFQEVVMPTAKVHPLLHKNVTILKEQGYVDSAATTVSKIVLENGDNDGKRARPQRINLPTYPFAREHCWPDHGPDPKQQVAEPRSKVANLHSIEVLINKIDQDSVDTDQAVLLLKELI